MSGFFMRAYISVEPLGINQYGPGDNFLGHVAIRNRGRVPARNVSYVIDIDWKPDGHWGVSKPGNIVPRDIVLQPRTEIKLGSPFKPNTLVQSTANPSYLYVFGRVEYQDGFRKERRFTNFCHRYNCEVIKFGSEHLLPSGNGRYHEKHNDAD